MAPKDISNAKGSFFNDGREQALHTDIFSQNLDKLRNNPQAILDAINQHTRSKQRMMIFHQEKLDISIKALESMNPKPKVIVELGCYVGTSAVAWGAALKKMHAESEDLSECRVYSMELDPKFAKIAQDFVDLAGLGSIVEIVQGTSTDSIKSLKTEGKLHHIDMVFFDHWEEFYLPDLRLCEELGLLKKGSLLIADNTDMPGAPDYLKYVKAGGSGEAGKVRYESETIIAPVQSGPTAVEISTVVKAP